MCGRACSAPDEPDMEYAIVDAAVVKVHRHGQGARGGLKVRLSPLRLECTAKSCPSPMRSALVCFVLLPE